MHGLHHMRAQPIGSKALFPQAWRQLRQHSEDTKTHRSKGKRCSMKTVCWPRCGSRHYRNRRSSSVSAPVDEHEPGATHCRQRQHILRNGGQAVETAAHVERFFLPPDTRGARKQRRRTRMRSSTPPGNARSMSQSRAVRLSASAPAMRWIGYQSSADT